MGNWLQLKDDIVTSQDIMLLGFLEIFMEPTDVSLLNSRGSCKFSINTVAGSHKELAEIQPFCLRLYVLDHYIAGAAFFL